jgi:type I restriction enzyme, S subunit
VRVGWEQKRLGEVCSLINRGVAPKYIEAGGIAVLNQKCVRDHQLFFDLGRRHDVGAKKVDAERYIRVGDVLVNSTGVGTLGRVAQVRLEPQEPTTVDTHVTIVRPEPGRFYPDFFGYMLIQIEDEIARSGEGASGQTELARSTLQNKFTVSFPTLASEQQRIVAILDEAFAGLAAATANAEKNLQNARGLPASAFALIFSEGAGQWPSTTIGGQVTLQRGFDITKRQQNTGQIPVVSSGGIKSFHDTAMAQGPGVVLGRKGSLGTVFYVDQDYWPHDTTLWVKDFKGNNAKFVYYFFKSLDLAKLDTGTANPALNRNVVHPLAVNWPPREKQAEIVERIEAISDDAERLGSNYQRSLAGMANLKQSILQKAFSGELTSPPSQAIKEAAE